MINEATLAESIRRLRQGERATLAQAMTLVESRHPRHQALSTQLLDAIMPYCGNALRLGVTGTPGAGKSTFLEAFGMLLIREGLKVAVIAVDPSSPVTGGSILGDKTRMNDLARAEAAFIRPVPSSGHLGGASQRARELMLLCEAAGYDVVIVETVGVGQSETEVARMVDCFISLQIAGGGDDLQGIKKGLMEVADLLVINKDDGDNHTNVAIARHMYESALHILRRKYDEWQPRVLTCSALEKRGIDEIWHAIIDFKTALTASGRLQQVRQQQSVEWLRKQTEEEVLNHLFANEDFDRYYRQTLLAVKNNTLSPRTGLRSSVNLSRRNILIKGIFMSYQYVNVATINKVAVIEFNYGRKLNALSKVFIDDLMQALSDLNRPEIRCIILRAPSGSKVFSAGHDIHELPSGGRDPLSYDDPLRQITRMIQKFPKPIISMVEGSVWGGAFEMIMSSDLIIAASTSTFSMTPVNLGVPYNLVGIHNLTRDAGFHIVKELIFTASPITAQRALAVGILNHVVEVEELEDFTLQMAHHISEKAPLAIAVIKEELRVLGEAHTMNSDEFERIQGMRRAVYDSEDYQEGMNAFLEKRKPNFVGH